MSGTTRDHRAVHRSMASGMHNSKVHQFGNCCLTSQCTRQSLHDHDPGSKPPPWGKKCVKALGFSCFIKEFPSTPPVRFVVKRDALAVGWCRFSINVIVGSDMDLIRKVRAENLQLQDPRAMCVHFGLQCATADVFSVGYPG